jgi:uncharacterized membrane protein
MTQRSDYWQTAAYFLLAIVGITLFYVFMRMFSTFILLPLLAGVVGWELRGFFGNSKPEPLPPLIIEQDKLEHLRELHRVGNG